MSRVVTATITFEFLPDEDEAFLENGFTDEEMFDYYREIVSSDIAEMGMRYPDELWNSIEVQVHNV
jgi:hypothetical protein